MDNTGNALLIVMAFVLFLEGKLIFWGILLFLWGIATWGIRTDTKRSKHILELQEQKLELEIQKLRKK